MSVVDLSNKALKVKGRSNRLSDKVLKQLELHCCCLVGGSLYVLFGDETDYTGNKFKYSSAGYALDLKSLEWRMLSTEFSPGRQLALSFLQEDLIFAYSGKTVRDYVEHVQVYDPVLMSWSLCKVKGNVPTGRYGSCGEYFAEFDCFIVFGGRSLADYYLADTKWLSLTNKTWVEPVVKGRPPAPRSFHSSCSKRDTMFIFGGYSARGQLDDLHLLKPTGPSKLSYTRLKSSAVPVSSPGLTLFNSNYFIVIGGGRGGIVSQNTLVYNIHEDRWFSTNHVSQRYGHQTITWGNKILLFGGSNQSSLLCEVITITIRLDRE